MGLRELIWHDESFITILHDAWPVSHVRLVPIPNIHLMRPSHAFLICTHFSKFSESLKTIDFVIGSIPSSL